MDRKGSMPIKRPTPHKPTPMKTPIAIREIAVAFQQSRVLLTAFELGLFTVLGLAGKSSNQVAGALGTDKRATDRLMNALCAMGFLRKKNGRFSNTPSASRFLVKGKSEYMAGLMHTVHLWNTWSTLTRAVRQGTSVATGHAGESMAEWRTAFIAAMQERASKIAPSVIATLDLSGVSRVLDVGGGSGAYSIAFVRARSGLKATVFDLPGIIPLTKDYVGREELLDREESFVDRVDFVSGDYTVDDLADNRGGGYDLVFLSQIVHSNPVVENRRLIRKCARALNPGGQVVVQEFIMNENRTGPAQAALFALNMLVGTEAGDTYTEAEVRSWIKAAGLTRIVRRDTEFGTALIIGHKDRR